MRSLPWFILAQAFSRTTAGLVVALCMAAVLAAPAGSRAGVDRVQQSGAVAGAHASGALPAVIAAVEASRRGAPIPSSLTPARRGLPPDQKPPGPCIGHDRSSVITTRICRIGDRSSRRLIVLMGDSHAMMWLPALLEMARRDGWAVIPLLRLGCTPDKWRGGYGDVPCEHWYRWAIGEVARLHPSVTLLGGSIGERPSPYVRSAIDGVVATAPTLTTLGHVVVIGDPEGLDRSPVDCLRSPKASMATCTTIWSAQSLAAYDEVARRVTQEGAGFLPTRGFVCFDRRCPAVIDHTVAWVDDNHLSATYAVRIAGAFRAAFVRAIQRHGR